MSNQKLTKQKALAVHSSDIIIAVMGPTGTGKSNLIEQFYPNGQMGIAKEQLESVTRSISAYRLKNHPCYGDRVVLVDTPGFDDSKTTDMAILKMIGEWMDKTYRHSNHQTLLAGILYLHRIVDNRITGTASRNLAMFGKLCGSKAASKVILITTMWDKLINDVAREEAKEREQELRENYWKPLIDLGSRVETFDNTSKKAELILTRVVEQEQQRTLTHIQEELVHLGKPIRETDAGMALYDALQRLLKERRDTLDELMKDEATQTDKELLKTLSDQRRLIEMQLEESLNNLGELKIGFLRKFLLLFRIKKATTSAVTLAM